MDINQTLENLRVSYQMAQLDISDCDKNPMEQFNKWFEHATLAKCDEPNAFVLSTAKNNQPHARVVLLKGINKTQFVFYTNYKSAKGIEIENNDKVAMTFLWLPLHRQVRIEGTVQKVSEKISEDYFSKRPRGSQLGAIASPQSEKISGRDELEKLFLDLERKFVGIETLPRPKNWGGYEITPVYLEFWQGRDNRMHDRICYELQGGDWSIFRRAP